MTAPEHVPYFFIFNPASGTGGRSFSAIRELLRARGIPFSAAATTAPGDARTLARLAADGGFRAIVSVGGDGTMNEVLNGLATVEGLVGNGAALAVIPRGTAQDFARGVGIPLGLKAAVQRLLAGRERRVDVGRIRFANGQFHLFANVLGSGFDAEVAGRAQDVRGAMSSIPAHVVGFASALAAYQNKKIDVALEGGKEGTVRVQGNMVIAANGPSYAGGMRLAPDAKVDDGLLDVVVIGNTDKIEILLNLTRVLSGTHVEHDKVHVYHARSIKMESMDDALVQADGEVVGRLPVQVDVLPRALRVIC